MQANKRQRTNVFGSAKTFTRVQDSFNRQRKTFTRRPTPMMKRMVAASKETGFVDTASAVYNFDTTGTIALIATVPQGTTVNSRVGKKVMWKSLQARGYAQNNTTAIYNDCAFLVVYDKRPTGALPAITDILNTASSVSFNNDNNSGRFQILKRWDGELIGPVTGVIATQQLTERSAISTDFFLDLHKKQGVFKGLGTGAIADIEEGALYFVTVGQVVAGTAAALAQMAFRVRFYDS